MSKAWTKRQAGLIRGTLIGAALAAIAGGIVLMQPGVISAEENDNDKDARVDRATNFSPIAITSDNKFVWSVNPDNNSVSVFLVAEDAHKKVAEIPVGTEPWCVAITPPEKDRKSPGDDDGKSRDAPSRLTRPWGLS